VLDLYFLAVACLVDGWVEAWSLSPGLWLESGWELIAQAGDAAGAVEGAAEGGGGAAADNAGGGGPGAADEPRPNLLVQIIQNPLTLITGLIFLFYILVLVPERRRQAETAKRRSQLKKNDRVVTTGGILGTVVGVTPESDEITIRVDDATNTKIRVLRSAIGTISSSGKEEKSGS
jgi:preprotein translocase subunit YajC